MSALKRQISQNISDQQVEGTCYAHSIARVILNAIRQTIPEYFYPMESDLCNNIYWTGIFSNLDAHIREYKCGEHTTNNISLFAYIYKTITDSNLAEIINGTGFVTNSNIVISDALVFALAKDDSAYVNVLLLWSKAA